MAARVRGRCADDRVTNDRQVSACRLDSGRAMPRVLSMLQLDFGDLGRSREASAPACKRLPRTLHARWLRFFLSGFPQVGQTWMPGSSKRLLR
jgi:hypothetical protein